MISELVSARFERILKSDFQPNRNLPHKTAEKQYGEFLVEDYFKKNKVIELSKQIIDAMFTDNVRCKNHPKISEMIKSEALPNHCKVSTAADMEDFKALLSKLNQIVLKPSDV